MTKQLAVGRAYQWAMQVTGNRKSGVMLLYCAKQLSAARDLNPDYDDAYAAMQSLLAEWREQKRPGMDKVLAIVEPMMVLERSFSGG